MSLPSLGIAALAPAARREVLSRLPTPAMLSVLRFRAHAALRRDGPTLDNWARRFAITFTTMPRQRAEWLASQVYLSRHVSRDLRHVIWARSPVSWPSVAVEGSSHLRAAQANGGVVLLGAHVGLPQLARWYLRATSSLEVLYLVRIARPGSDGAAYQRWLRRRRGFTTPDLLGQQADGRDMKRCLDHLRRGGGVFVTADGFAGRGTTVSILGQEQTLRLGGAALARLSRSTIVPVTSGLDPFGRIRIRFQPPLEVPRAGTSAERDCAVAEQMARRIETVLRETPIDMAPRYLLPV